MLHPAVRSTVKLLRCERVQSNSELFRGAIMGSFDCVSGVSVVIYRDVLCFSCIVMTLAGH